MSYLIPARRREVFYNASTRLEDLLDTLIIEVQSGDFHFPYSEIGPLVRSNERLVEKLQKLTTAIEWSKLHMPT